MEFLLFSNVLGNVSFQGEISGYFTDLVTYGQLQTSLGNVKTDLKFEF